MAHHRSTARHAAAVDTLEEGMQVKITRGGNTDVTRNATIESIDYDTNDVKVKWLEAGTKMHKKIPATEILALNPHLLGEHDLHKKNDHKQPALKLGQRVTIPRGGGGTRHANIESFDPESGIAKVIWDEGGEILYKDVSLDDIQALNDL